VLETKPIHSVIHFKNKSASQTKSRTMFGNCRTKDLSVPPPTSRSIYLDIKNLFTLNHWRCFQDQIARVELWREFLELERIAHPKHSVLRITKPGRSMNWKLSSWFKQIIGKPKLIFIFWYYIHGYDKPINYKLIF